MTHLSGHQSTWRSTCPLLVYLIFHSCICLSPVIHQLLHTHLSCLHLLMIHLLAICGYTYQSSFLSISSAFSISSSITLYMSSDIGVHPFTVSLCVSARSFVHLCFHVLLPHSEVQEPHFFRGSLTHAPSPWKSNWCWSRPVIVSIAQCPHRDAEGLPYWVQCVFHNLCLVADGEPGGRQETRNFLGVALRPLLVEIPKIPHSLSMGRSSGLGAVWAQLTCHLHCSCRTQGKGLTSQRSPFCPACLHTAAW